MPKKTADIELETADEPDNQGEVDTRSSDSHHIHPANPGGRSESRLFQSAPHKKEWLTKEQATARGFYWKD